MIDQFSECQSALKAMQSSTSIFYACAKGNDAVEPIAKGVTLRKILGKNPAYFLSWSDVSHQRKFEVKSVKVLSEEQGIEFEDKQGRIFKLALLTLDCYNKEVKDRVGGPIFTTDKELKDYFLNQPW